MRLRQVDRSTARLVTASDDRSVPVAGRLQDNGTAPVVVLVQRTPGTGAGPTHNDHEGADMAKRTRGPDSSDRLTRDSGVNITPPTLAGPVTSTVTVA